MVDFLIKSLQPDEPSGDPISVAFVNTVGSRRSSRPDEYLKTPHDLQDWMARRGLVGASTTVEESDRERALVLRDAIYRLLSAAASRQPLQEDDIEALNDELCEALAKLELTAELDFTLTGASGLDRALMVIAISAAALLTSELLPRIRECANETCGWIFIDRSKNRSRRWCDMSDCGNREKARRFQQRHRADRGKTHA